MAGRPTPTQARILKSMVDNPGVRILWKNYNAAWIGPRSWKVKDQLGTLRSKSVRALEREGWIAEDPNAAYCYMISPDGLEAIDQLAPDAFVAPVPDMTADDVRAALRRHFAPPDWWLGEEIMIKGWRDRFIDAMAVRLTAGEFYDRSSYLTVWAIEIKVSRSDYQHELGDPMKRRPAIAISDVYSFAAPVGMIKPDELPEGAGLIEVDGHRLTIPVMGNLRRKDPPDWPLVAAMLRQSSD